MCRNAAPFALSVVIALIAAALLVASGCGGSSRHTTGIYSQHLAQPYEPSAEAATPAGEQPAQLQGPTGLSPAGMDGEPLGLSTRVNMTTRDVFTSFIDHAPPQGTTVIESSVDISVRLQIERDSDGRTPDIDGLQIGRAMMDVRKLGATLTREADGYRVDLGVQHISQGLHEVVVTLFDAAGHIYSTSWIFTADSNLPHYAGISSHFAAEAGEPYRDGYCVFLDKPVASGHVGLVVNPDNWDLRSRHTLAPIRIDRISPIGDVANEVVLYSEDVGLESGDVEVDFRPSLPGYDFHKRAVTKGVSWNEIVDLNCEDCDPPPPPDPPPTPEQIEGVSNRDGPGEYGVLDPECCNHAICSIDQSNDCQCCLVRLTINRYEPCRTCTAARVWRRNAVYRGDDEPGTFHPTHQWPHPDAPGPYDEEGTNSFVDHRGDDQIPGYDPVELQPDLYYVDGPLNAGQWVFATCKAFQEGEIFWLDFRPDWSADYWIQVGTLKMNMITFEQEWCTAWERRILGVKGDHENPWFQSTIITGAEMRAELDNISDPQAFCSRWWGNDDAEHNQLIAEYEAGCGKVMKVHVKDKCFRGDVARPWIEKGGDSYLVWWLDACTNNIDVFDDPIRFECDKELYWKGWEDNLIKAYLCDYTHYPDCAAQNPTCTGQEWVFYYLISRDLVPFCQEVNGSSDYAQEIRNTHDPTYTSCDTYIAWPQDDFHFGGINGTDCNKGCGFKELHVEGEWIKAFSFWKHVDGKLIDPMLHFQEIPLPVSNGCWLIPYTENNPGPDGYLVEVFEPEIKNDSIHFAIYFEAEREGNSYGSELGVPLLFINFEDDEEWDLDRTPDRFCRGFDTINCEKVQTAVWTFECVRPEMDDVDIKANTHCNYQEFTYGEGDYSFDLDVLEDVPEGLPMYLVAPIHRIGKDLGPLFEDVLTNPCVSGGEEDDHDGPWENYEDGPVPYALARVCCCEQPTDVSVYIDMNEYEPVESAKPGIDVGNAFEQGDDEVDGQADWVTWMNIQDSQNNHAYPPVYIWYDTTTDRTRPADGPTAALHNNYADENPTDPYDDIIRTYPSPLATDDFSSGAPVFTVAWDGRQWLLDEGTLIFDNLTPVYEVSHYHEDTLYGGDGGSTMFPPGKYHVMFAATFPSTGSYSIPLGDIHLAYGGGLLHGHSDDYGTFLPGASDGFTDSHVTSSLYGADKDYQQNIPIIFGLKYITRITGTEYTSVLSFVDHDRIWNKYYLGWEQPVQKDLVILHECFGFTTQYIGTNVSYHGLDCGGTESNPCPQFNTKVFMGYRGLMYYSMDDEWSLHFYNSLLGLSGVQSKTIRASWSYARDKMINMELVGREVYNDRVWYNGGYREFYPEIVPSTGPLVDRFVTDPSFEKTDS